MRLITGLMVMLCILTFFVYLFFYFKDNQYYPVSFPLIPFFYLLYGIWLSFLLNKKKTSKGVSIKKMIVIRIVRIVSALVLLLIGILLDKDHIISYIVLFLLYYVAYLLFETKMMTDLSKTKKHDV